MLLWIALACTKAEPLEPEVELDLSQEPIASPYPDDCLALANDACFPSTEAACASLDCGAQDQECVMQTGLPPRALCMAGLPKPPVEDVVPDDDLPPDEPAQVDPVD
jgi:hypothetical protein